jgi:septal ring factor EnvC (AmiA/AmiB activator)
MLLKMGFLRPSASGSEYLISGSTRSANSSWPKRKARPVFGSTLRSNVYPISAFALLFGVELLKFMPYAARSDFEEEQLNILKQRLASLESMVNAEKSNLSRLEQQKEATQAEISQAEEELAVLQAELEELQAKADEKTKEVEQVKRTTSKASKVLDQAIKEIELMVRFYFVSRWLHN